MRNKIAICLCLCFLLQQGLNAETTKLPLKVVELRQGLLFKFPAGYELLGPENIAKVHDTMDAYAAGTPKFAAKVDAASLAFAAVDDKASPKFQVTLLVLPPEMPQAELKAFDAERAQRLQDLMYEQSKAQFAKLGVSVTTKHKPRVLQGKSLSFFLWGYEFNNRAATPQASFRAFYYTKKATFILGVSGQTEFVRSHSKSVMEILGSLNTSVDPGAG